MQLRPEQLGRHLERTLARLYVVHGDEALLVQEAEDAIRAAARAAGAAEREVHTVTAGRFDWSMLLASAQSPSLFSARRLIEIRIPSGKPGKDGGEALERYCARLADDVTTIVRLPRLDASQAKTAWFGALDAAGVGVRCDPVERGALPTWIAQRLAQQQQRVEAGEAGARTLAYFADRVEGNLLAAHQEVHKLALLYPAGELSFEEVESAVLDVARYDVRKLGDAVLAGQLARSLRMLAGLRAAGEAPALVHWSLAEDLRALARARRALDGGEPLPLALRAARVWGAKERLVEQALPRLDERELASLLLAANVCDGVVKGLRAPGWPTNAWDALARLVLLMLQALRPEARVRLALPA